MFDSPDLDGSVRTSKATSLPRGVEDGVARGREWDLRVDALADVGNGSDAAEAAAEAGGAGAGKTRSGGFKRMFSSVPSPSHLRRSMSLASSFSAFTSAATRVANGAMTPIRRRRRRRDGSHAGDSYVDGSGRSDGRATDGGGGSGGRRSRLGSTDGAIAHACTDHEGIESPDRTGVLSPEDDCSPPRTKRVGAAAAAGQAKVTNDSAASATRSEDANKPGGEGGRSKEKAGSVSGVAVSSESGVMGATPETRRRSKTADRRRQQSARARRSRSPPIPGDSSPDDEPSKATAEELESLTKWSWGATPEPTEGIGGGGQRANQGEGGRVGGGSGAKREESNGRPPSHDGEFRLFVRWFVRFISVVTTFLEAFVYEITPCSCSAFLIVLHAACVASAFVFVFFCDDIHYIATIVVGQCTTATSALYGVPLVSVGRWNTTVVELYCGSPLLYFLLCWRDLLVYALVAPQMLRPVVVKACCPSCAVICRASA